MHLRPISVLLVLLVCGMSIQAQTSASPAQPASGRRVALVIGNNIYPGQELKNAVNDATSMANALRSEGYSTTLLTNTTLAQLEGGISTFTNGVQTGDVALMYYAGHGFQIDGENYFVPVDFAASDPSTAKTRAVPMSRVTNSFTQQHVHAGILIADACRNNPFGATRGLYPGLAAMSGGAGIVIGLATFPGGVAFDNPGQGNGLYTKALLDNMRRPGLSVDQVFSGAASQVSRESEGKQVPWTGSALRGVVIFGNSPPPVGHSAEGPPATSAFGPQMRAVGVPMAPGGLPSAVPAPVAISPDRASSGAAAPLPQFIVSPNIMRNPRGLDPLGPDLDDSGTFAQIADLLHDGNVQTAQTELANIGKQGTMDYRFAYYAGRVALAQDRYPDALAAFNLAIQQAPLNPLPLYLRALTYALLGQYQAGLSDISAALGDRPLDARFLMAEANVLFVTGRYADGIVLCNQVIASDRLQAAAYLIRGNCERMLGDAASANADYISATRLQSAQ